MGFAEECNGWEDRYYDYYNYIYRGLEEFIEEYVEDENSDFDETFKHFETKVQKSDTPEVFVVPMIRRCAISIKNNNAQEYLYRLAEIAPTKATGIFSLLELFGKKRNKKREEAILKSSKNSI